MKITKEEEKQAREIASSWRSLNQHIEDLSEKQLSYLIYYELNARPTRTSVYRRLKQRLGAVTAEKAKKSLKF